MNLQYQHLNSESQIYLFQACILSKYGVLEGSWFALSCTVYACTDTMNFKPIPSHRPHTQCRQLNEDRTELIMTQSLLISNSKH